MAADVLDPNKPPRRPPVFLAAFSVLEGILDTIISYGPICLKGMNLAWSSQVESGMNADIFTLSLNKMRCS